MTGHRGLSSVQHPSTDGPTDPTAESERVLRVLCVEDEPDHADLLHRALAKVPGVKLQFDLLTTSRDLTEILARDEHDVVFLDYCLGTNTGLSVLKNIRLNLCQTPVIVLTAHGDEYLAAELTRHGADEYLVKRDLNPARLSRALSNAVGNANRRMENAQLLDRISSLETLSRRLAESNASISIDARMDALTQVLNRRAWEDAASTEDARAREEGKTYGIIMFDIDQFKRFNDSAGHLAGDQCLTRVAELIRSGCRPDDVVGRYGGEEFVVLLPRTDREESEAVAQRVLEAVRHEAYPHQGLGPDATLTISGGVAIGPTDGTWVQVLDAADKAMYRAKGAGRDRIGRPAA